MTREYFDYDEGHFVNLGGTWHFIVEGKSLDELETWAEMRWRSTIALEWGEDEGPWYRPADVRITKGCDGMYIFDFILEEVY